MIRIIAAVEVGGAHVEETLLLQEVHDDQPRPVAVGQQAEHSVQGQAGDLERGLLVNRGIY